MRALIFALLLLPSLAFAQNAPDPARDVVEKWRTVNDVLSTFADRLSALLKEREQEKAQAADADARLKWVLDNWVKAP